MIPLMLALLGAAQAGPAEDTVIEALLPRDGAPACASVASDLPGADRLEALIAVAEQVERPPWVPMRAAGCVAELAAGSSAARRVALRWMREVEAPGRALVVVQHVDAWPADQAAVLAERAVDLGGRHPRFGRYALPVLAASEHAAVREHSVVLERIVGE